MEHAQERRRTLRGVVGLPEATFDALLQLVDLAIGNQSSTVEDADAVGDALDVGHHV